MSPATQAVTSVASTDTPSAAVGAKRDGARGVQVDAHDLGVERNGRAILSNVNLSIRPGELVAVIGSSGAGKSTLLDALAGLRPPSAGVVTFDGSAGAPPSPHLVGYVPQDDIIHRDLPVAATFRYAARLRLANRTPHAEIDRVVADTLDELDLTGRAAVRVADLSGGQRKRVSIGVELLAKPRAFFLDEPTSGLDPATASSLMGTLRHLADLGTTVVLTTHNTDDLRTCDRIIVVANGGVVFEGSPQQARGHFDVEQLADIYLRISPETPAFTPGASVDAAERQVATQSTMTPDASDESRHQPASGLHQWRVLAGRNTSILRHNRLTLSIMLGAPALVIAMFAALFRSGALASGRPDAAAAVSTAYWMAFATFFFGLTYGLLQICTEIAVVRREAFIGVRVGPYLAAKITVLAPVLAAVNITMLGVLRGLDRLPSLSDASYARIAVTLFVASLAALALGLLASAAVADPAQATLALPMLCFPAVLFGGAVVAVPTMDLGGRLLSIVEITRWTFEALGHDLGLSSLLAHDGSGGSALLAQHGRAFDHSTLGHWALLAVFIAVFMVASGKLVRRRASAR